MILLTDAASIIESIYLGEGLSVNKFDSKIIVNPDNPFYMNKNIYVNTENYDLSILSELSKNNVIKSRIKLNNATFKYTLVPYRSDRIKRISIKKLGESDYSASRYDLSKLIIFKDTLGNFATILPKDIKNNSAKNITAFELYLSIVKSD